MVMESGWQSFDRQFELRTLPPRIYGCALAVWPVAVPKPMVEYIDPDYLFLQNMPNMHNVRNMQNMQNMTVL